MKTILLGCIATLLFSCNSKQESKEIEIPKPKTGKAQEILDSLYTEHKGYECDLDDDGASKMSKVFYIDRTDTREDGKLFHKFYTVKEDSEKVDTDIKIGEFSFWFLTYSDNGDDTFSASTPTSKKESDGKVYKAKLDFDNKVNEFSYKIVNEEFEGTSFVEKETLNTGVITNCIEASYKILNGLD